MLFYALWIFALPLGLAVGSVWLLTPEHSPSGQPLPDFVSEQQIPVGIVLFTLFAMIVWRFRHDLPLASALGVGGRRDIPHKVRARFEDAQMLLEEARRILRTRKRDVERELTQDERTQVDESLRALEHALTADRFDQAEFDTAHSRADKVVGEHLGRWRKGEMREYAESIGIAVAVALILRVLVIEAFKIPSGSMIPTLMVGDHIFVNKFTYGPLIPWTDWRLWSRLPPSRGDVMVFKYPGATDTDFIKRTIAVPGDTLEAINGRPIINGWLVPHCYVGPYSYPEFDPKTGKKTVHQAELYVEFLEDKSYLTLHNAKTDQATCTTEGDCPASQCRMGICGTLQGPYTVGRDQVMVMGDNRDNSSDSRMWGAVPFKNIKGRAMFVWVSIMPYGGIAWDRISVNVMGKPHLPPGEEREPDLGNLRSGIGRCLEKRPSETTPPSRR